MKTKAICLLTLLATGLVSAQTNTATNAPATTNAARRVIVRPAAPALPPGQALYNYESNKLAKLKQERDTVIKELDAARERSELERQAGAISTQAFAQTRRNIQQRRVALDAEYRQKIAAVELKLTKIKETYKLNSAGKIEESNRYKK